MPTVEERLAALEAKMAQLTETTPTTYYTHQYSGEEIDAAVGRAVTGGALDTSVTNVSNQLGTFVRPNLLDNWYFGNPVDQRKGYIQIGGTMMYKDAACTDQFGPSSGTTPVVVYATYARPIDKGVELALYIPLNNIVRGYMGNGYTVDRWSLSTDGGNVTISNGYLDIYASKQHGTYLAQKIDPELAKAIAGKTVTWSVLAVGGDSAFSANINKDDSYVDSFTIEPNTISFKTLTFPTDFTDISFVFAGNSAGHVCPIAAKLELGPTQTLAHREGDKWVMNEVPKYSRELLDCRMYHVKFGYADKYCILGSGVARDGTFVSITVPIPAEMRTYPVVILTGVIIIRHSDGGNQSCTTLALDAIGVSSILLKIKASGLTPGDAYEAFLTPGNYLDVSCDL